MFSEDSYVPLSSLQIVEAINSGTSSSIYKVIDKNTGKTRIIKVFLNEFSSNLEPSIKEKIIREYMITAKVNKKFIILLKGFTMFEIEDKPYLGLVLQYFPNGTLEQFLELRRSGTAEPEYTSYITNAKLFFGLIGGLYYLHEENIVHRNLTPKNIMIDKHLFPKIIDFGLAIFTNRNYSDEVYLDDPKELVDPIYVAPEVWTKNRCSPASDIYSYGMILYEIVTGKKPFEGLNKFQIIQKVTEEEARPEIPDDVPDYLKDLIIKCWSQEPQDRPTSKMVKSEAAKLMYEGLTITQDLQVASDLELWSERIGHTKRVNFSWTQKPIMIMYPDSEKDGQPFNFNLDPINISEFKKERKIGEGSFGSVFEVIYNKTGKLYAAKVSKYEIDCHINSNYTMNFFREVSVLSRMKHPAIIRFIGYTEKDFSDNNKPIIITDFVTNGSLGNIIDCERRTIPIKGWNDTKKLINIYGIASAMNHIHSLNILHRDLKPDNILVDDYLLPIVTDFGLAMDLTCFDHRYENANAGTVVYMAPESIERTEYTKKSDVYSFGILVYEIMTCELLYPEMNYYQVSRLIVDGDRPKFKFHIPECYKLLIQSCWDKDPKKRPSFKEIVELIQSDERFMDSIDKDDFDDYVDYINEYLNTPKTENLELKIQNFINSHEKAFKKIDIHESIPKVTTVNHFTDLNGFLNLKNFEKQEKIGASEFSKVYKIKMKGTKTVYAAKVSKLEINSMSKDDAQKISKEVEIISRLNHPSIQKTLGYSVLNFKNDKKPVIITELSSNGTLEDVLKIERKGETVSGWDNTKNLIVIFGIASSMSYLHSYDILHRNLKPTNIFIDDKMYPKIADFGYYTQNYVEKTMTHQATMGMQGSPEYLAPEILNGGQFIKPSDVYSFAIIVFEIVTKEKAFAGNKNNVQLFKQVVIRDERPKINPSVPDCYKELLEHCWTQDPDERLTFDEIVDFLKNDNRFFTKSINKKEYLNYIQYIEANTKEASINDEDKMNENDSLIDSSMSKSKSTNNKGKSRNKLDDSDDEIDSSMSKSKSTNNKGKSRNKLDDSDDEIDSSMSKSKSTNNKGKSRNKLDDSDDEIDSSMSKSKSTNNKGKSRSKFDDSDESDDEVTKSKFDKNDDLDDEPDSRTYSKAKSKGNQKLAGDETPRKKKFKPSIDLSKDSADDNDDDELNEMDKSLSQYNFKIIMKKNGSLSLPTIEMPVTYHFKKTDKIEDIISYLEKAKNLTVITSKLINQLDKQETPTTRITSKQYRVSIGFKPSNFDYLSLNTYDDDKATKHLQNLYYIHETVRQMNHPNIAKTIGFSKGYLNLGPSILIESFSQKLKDVIQSIDDIYLVTIIYEISHAMMTLHSNNLAHRNLEPENVLLDSKNHVKIVGFDVPVLLSLNDQKNRNSSSKDIWPSYCMSPQIHMNDKCDEKTDVFSFGMIAYFILKRGRKPYISLSDILDGKKMPIPKSINKLSYSIIRRCLSYQPDQRPSFKAITKTIERFKFNLIEGIESKVDQIKNHLKPLINMK